MKKNICPFINLDIYILELYYYYTVKHFKITVGSASETNFTQSVSMMEEMYTRHQYILFLPSGILDEMTIFVAFL